MAKIVNKIQETRTRVLSPRPSYSRVVQIQVNARSGIGNVDYCYTAMLGNEIRLLQVQAYMFKGIDPDPIGGFVYIATGNTEPQSAGEIINQWEMIMPNQCGGKPGIYWWGLTAQFTWDMDRLYSGKERRFAVAIANGFNVNWWGLFWFQFSEG